MAIRFQETQLSVSPPSYPMADTDRHTFTFSLPTASTATLASVELSFSRTDPAPLEEIDDVASLVSIAGKTATVLVDAREGMSRGMSYELAVTLVGSDGDTETLTLAFLCEA